MTPEDYVADLRRWEGVVPHMYLDQKGLVTTGVGNLLATIEDALALPWERRGQPATREEVEFNYGAVQALPWGMAARRYVFPDGVTLTSEAIDELLVRRIEGFLDQLHRRMVDFPKFPDPAKRALMDMIFTLGAGGLFGTSKLHGFPNLVRACRLMDWRSAADHCHRRAPCREERNAWVRGLFLEAAGQ